jgi:hypothetical protein
VENRKDRNLGSKKSDGNNDAPANFAGGNFKRPGGYVETFEVSSGDHKIGLEDANWADWDQAGRLVFSRAGQLLAGRIHDGQLNSKLLADFNDNRPTKLAAPEWALSWVDDLPAE